MSKQEIFDYLKELDLCKACLLRYLDGRCNEYEDLDKSFRNVSFCLNRLLVSSVG